MSRNSVVFGSCAALVLGLCFASLYPRAQAPADVPAAAIEQNNVGVGYMNQYLYAEAAAAFRKALAASPRFNLARVNLGIALLYKQDYDEALLTLQDALTQASNSPYAHYTLGLLYKNKGESEKAVEHFSRVTQIDPRDAASFYHLGVLKARLRQNGEAETALKRCLELEPLNTSALYNLGTLLLKLGRADEGNRLLERFRSIQQQGEAGGGMSIGNQYGEMGAYALAADFMPAGRPSAIAARPGDALAPFKDISAEAGLAALAASAGDSLAFPAGGGLALSDLDGDGDVDVIVTRSEPGPNRFRTFVLANDGKGRFTDVTAASGIPATGHTAVAVGDYDNDGMPDLYLAGAGALLRNQGQARFQDVTKSSGIGDGASPGSSATFVDYDHDGDLDLYVCHNAAAANRMFRNNGNGTFTDVTDALGVGGNKRPSIGMVPTDIDNDRDIDLVVTHLDSPPQVFSNERSDRFTDVSQRIGATGAGAAAVLRVADFDRNGAMDFFASALKGSGTLLLNKGDGLLQPDARSPELLRADSRFGSGVVDYDNDGDLDLYTFGQNGGALWENTGDGRFVFAGRLPVDKGARSAAAADFDGDGRVDILYIDSSGNPRLLHNELKAARHWIGVQLEGLRSNKQGFGAKVEVRAGALYQKFEIQGHSGFLSQESPVVWIGLDTATKADTITVRWPSGILQSEINAAADRIVRVKELDRKGTSCPLLYTWNGKEFEFVTDFLGGSAYGYLVAPGRYNTPDTDEYVLIQGKQLMPRDGQYVLNLNNQLEEVIMFDQAQLLVVDHPAGTEIYPNERLLPAPPFPEFRIYTVRDARPPRSAVDDKGNDILPLIARKDRTYPTSFRSLPFKGYAEQHSITLDLGDLSGAKKALLLMDAWIDYDDSSSNLAASQAGVVLTPPVLQVKDAKGEWKTAIPSMGFPAGLPKTMTVDLTGKFLSRDYRVRITTNMKIYWDRIRVDTSEEAPVKVTRLSPVSADLHFRGYPAYYTPDGKQPWIYNYSRIQTAEFWGAHAGAYTRFGDVRELLLEKDDKFVISRHGDEIALAFQGAPPPENGWVRDYLLYADGFGKDMDMSSLYPESMGPLPFHGMSCYPYPPTEKYPDDAGHRAYRQKYNTRVFPVPQGHAPVSAQ